MLTTNNNKKKWGWGGGGGGAQRNIKCLQLWINATMLAPADPEFLAALLADMDATLPILCQPSCANPSTTIALGATTASVAGRYHAGTAKCNSNDQKARPKRSV
eukprot:SAG11_NODE_2003_length_3938_cov_1.717895_2_plen_104_part_00